MCNCIKGFGTFAVTTKTGTRKKEIEGYNICGIKEIVERIMFRIS